MAKKKPETKVEEVKNKDVEVTEINPEELMELLGGASSGGMQTIMSIGLAEKL